jgi:uncharacterized membrane protein YcaP (DUF421 family)
MLDLSIPVWELITRAVAVYAFLVVAFRLMGKKQAGELSPFDLIFLLIISEAVQNSLIAEDRSLVGGLITAAILVTLNYGTGWVTFKSKKAAALLEGTPELVVHDGRLVQATLDKQHLSREELMEALRGEGVGSLPEVRLAVLEANGKISVIKKAG